MKINRKDQLAIASMLYENFDGSPDTDDMSMGSMDDDLGMRGMDDTPEVSMDVMSIEPVAPVDSFDSAENEQVNSDLKKLAEYVGRLQEICSNCEVEPWMVAKISKAAEYVIDIYYMLDSSADFANMGFEQAPDTQSL